MQIFLRITFATQVQLRLNPKEESGDYSLILVKFVMKLKIWTMPYKQLGQNYDVSYQIALVSINQWNNAYYILLKLH